MPPKVDSGAVTIRDADQPGDIGTITVMHGRLYAEACGMDQTVEAYIADGLATFVYRRSEDGEAAGRCWVAEDDHGRIVGSIGVTRADAAAFQLRWFLIEPAHRGAGLGRALMRTALEHCRSQAADRIFLLTTAGLDTAHHLYRAMGFALVSSVPVRQWGIDAVEQRFEMALR